MQGCKNEVKTLPTERDKIALWRSQSISLREIARRLNRNVSSISREIRRNKFGKHYVAIHAQAKWEKKKLKAGNRHPLKNKPVYKYVVKKLKCCDST